MAQFYAHYRVVYGGQPPNDAFSLRFLRTYFATFIHKVQVDWVSEAIKRRNIRMDQKKLNRHRLGPVAIREQLATLCTIVNSIIPPSSGNRGSDSNSRTIRGSSSVAKAEAELK